MMTKESKKKIISIGEQFRFSCDELAVSIEEFVTIDPTKSARFNPEKHKSDIRQEWKPINKHFSTVEKAVDGLLDYKLKTGDSCSLKEIKEEIVSFKAFIKEELGI